MPALRTNTASGCWREVRRERESERRDGTAATNEFRQLPKIRPEIHHLPFPPIPNPHSPGPNPPTHLSILAKISHGKFPDAPTTIHRRKPETLSRRSTQLYEQRPASIRPATRIRGHDTRRAGRRERCR